MYQDKKLNFTSDHLNGSFKSDLFDYLDTEKKPAKRKSTNKQSIQSAKKRARKEKTEQLEQLNSASISLVDESNLKQETDSINEQQHNLILDNQSNDQFYANCLSKEATCNNLSNTCENSKDFDQHLQNSTTNSFHLDNQSSDQNFTINSADINYSTDQYYQTEDGERVPRFAANVRERRRMLSINSAFDELRENVPLFPFER